MADIIKEFEAVCRGEADDETLRRVEAALADPGSELSIHVARKLEENTLAVERGDPFFTEATQRLLEEKEGPGGADDLNGDSVEDVGTVSTTRRGGWISKIPIGIRIAVAASAALLLIALAPPLLRRAMEMNAPPLDVVDANVLLRTSVTAGNTRPPEEFAAVANRTVALPAGATFSIVLRNELGATGSLVVVRTTEGKPSIVFRSDNLEECRAGPGEPTTVHPLSVSSVAADYLVMAADELRRPSLSDVVAEGLRTSTGVSVTGPAQQFTLLDTLRRAGFPKDST